MYGTTVAVASISMLEGASIVIEPIINQNTVNGCARKCLHYITFTSRNCNTKATHFRALFKVSDALNLSFVCGLIVSLRCFRMFMVQNQTKQFHKGLQDLCLKTYRLENT